jgi:lysophospholipase L1-like esterase
MIRLLILFFSLTCNSSCSKNIPTSMPVKEPILTGKYSYLALGDSYTIGEMVPARDNFPNQVVSIMRNTHDLASPRIIARTGWTTDELEKGIVSENQNAPLQPTYDFVSLLIGVNNQYRGRSTENYKQEFEELLKKAIRFAGNRKERVIVLSIPDWGVTPFAEGRDRERIAREIDAYNRVNKEVSSRYQVYYLDITIWTREAGNDPSLLTSDGLHPSAKEYQRWAERVAQYFRVQI